MLFTSPSFFLFFLPLFLLIFSFFARGNRLSFAAKVVIIAGTYIFYGFENVSYLWPFVFATSMDLLWSTLLQRSRDRRIRKLIVTASVVQNLSLLLIFKYLNWIASTFPSLAFLQQLQFTFSDGNGTVALPPGLSFYLFESLSFVIDCYRGTVVRPRNSIDFLAFIAMFPRLIAGPIVRYRDLQDSIQNYRGMRCWDGLYVFSIGFTLKILFADSLGQFVDSFYKLAPSFIASWLGAIAYTFQIYIDFSAYSLMAIGLGMAIGFPFADNFREPYSSKSITEFWKRWHISLSSWLRDYLYIPLGGNRNGALRTYINLFLTMCLGGFWHGANITFLMWGMYHGVLLIAERKLKEHGYSFKSRAITLLLVVFGWVIFHAENPDQAARTFQGMFGEYGLGYVFARQIVVTNRLFGFLALVGVIWTLFIEPWVRTLRGGQPWFTLRLRQVPLPIIAFSMMLFGVAVCMALSAETVPFLYFQF